MNKSEALQVFKDSIISQVVSTLDFTKAIPEEDIYKCIDDAFLQNEERRNFSVSETLMIRKSIFNSLKKYDVIQDYLDDDEITEIMINGKDSIFIEKGGKLIKTERRFSSVSKLEDIIQQMVSGCNRVVNESSPIADARLSTGERVNIVLSPIAINGPIVTIRRFPKNPITMDKLISINSITAEAADFLKRLVEAKYNIFISGGTGSGKTTFLNALSQYIPKEERIITIEDSAELQLLNAVNIVRLETRNGNIEGCNEITIRDLIKSSLRMRPERIIVGEVRGAECLDMLQAMNTGHDGSLSTGHANSTKDMLSRLETMVIMGANIPIGAIRGQISSGIDIMVHLGRLRDKSRKVLEISEIAGIEDGEIKLSKLFEYEQGKLIRKGKLLDTYKYEKEFGTLDGLQIL
ncbi:MAG: CpaF family protein [Lachnospiraceae bacterium]|nr:CpaF family protein [Lachnospiraceae bacterium]